MSKERFYISTQGVDEKARHEAIQHACQLANSDSEITRIVLLIHTKGNTGWFDNIFDRDTVKKLFNGLRFSDCNVPLKIETKLTFKDNYNSSDIVITFGLDSEDVLKIEDYDSIKVIIAIPWLKEGLQKWVQTYSPTELRGKQEEVVAYPEPSCIVKKAMEELTSSINMSTGISHPSDEREAKTFILSLHKYEPSLDANIVGSYLVRELNWDTEDAKDIEKLINKHFQGGDRTGLQHHYKRWKEECK